jgi:hypothetical protein
MKPLCIGCTRVYPDGLCDVYGCPPSYFVRREACPFNPPKEEAKKKTFVNPLKASKRSKGK